MPKTPSSREKIRLQALQEPEKFQNDELVAAVCKYFCRGYPAAETIKLIKEKLGVTLSREDPHRLVAYACRREWLRFEAPPSFALTEQISEKYRWLKGVKVVRTGVSDDISSRVAEMLMDQVCELSSDRSPDEPVHIGFAGGKALRKTARVFSEMLREPRENLPKRIVFHAIVAGFIVTDPSTDPNGFFTYFAGETALQVQASFVGLPAPLIVKSSEIDKLRATPYMSEAFDGKNAIDIIVTSAGGHWQQGHSSFHSMLSMASKQTVDQLNKAGCIGDLMWRPLGKNGILDVRTDMRTVTLMEPDDLPNFIKGKGHRSVILLVGPCGNCGGPKGDVLAAILAKKNLITHLVADSRSVRQLLAMESGKPVAD